MIQNTMLKAKKNKKSSANRSCTKSYKRWTAFSWFLFGLIIFAGIGYATTIRDTGITNSPQINGIVYLGKDDGDLPTAINTLNTLGSITIIVENGTYASNNTIHLKSLMRLDMSSAIFNYTGTESAIFFNGTGITFDFDKIENGGYAKRALEVFRLDYSLINGNRIRTNFAEQAILINNTINSGGNNIWNIGTIDANHTTKDCLYITDSPRAYEGDTFNIGMMLHCNNTFIKVGDTGSSDKEHYTFNIGFDGVNDTTFIDTWNDKATYNIKSITDEMTNFDVILRNTSSDNLIITSRSDINISNNGLNNGIISPNIKANSYIVNTNQTITGVNNQVITVGNQNNVLTIFQIRPGNTASRSILELANSISTNNYATARLDANGNTFTISPTASGSPTLISTLTISGFNLTNLNSNYTKFGANQSNLICNSGSAGSVYYDGGTNKHYGCNSTTWNALY